jgi:hypothetical protein
MSSPSRSQGSRSQGSRSARTPVRASAAPRRPDRCPSPRSPSAMTRPRRPRTRGTDGTQSPGTRIGVRLHAPRLAPGRGGRDRPAAPCLDSAGELRNSVRRSQRSGHGCLLILGVVASRLPPIVCRSRDAPVYNESLITNRTQREHKSRGSMQSLLEGNGYARAGSSPPRSVPAISSSGAFSFGMKPDFIPKYTACGWCATIATVDCSGVTA